jgi:hypothetical protein
MGGIDSMPAQKTQPDKPGRWWFQGVAKSGLVTDRVQNRPLLVDEDLVPRDPTTGLPVDAELVGWWTVADAAPSGLPVDAVGTGSESEMGEAAP